MLSKRDVGCHFDAVSIATRGVLTTLSDSVCMMSYSEPLEFTMLRTSRVVLVGMCAIYGAQGGYFKAEPDKMITGMKINPLGI